MSKFYTVKETINGKEYVGQFNGISAMLDAVDQSYIDGTNVTSMKKYAQNLLDTVCVEPKGLTIDDFEDMDEFNKVIAFLGGVQRGEFRNKVDESTTTRKGSK